MGHDVNLPQAIAGAVAAFENSIAVFLLINVVLLFMGVFMDMTPATPIFLPVALELGIDPVHFGIVRVLNLCVGLCPPPVGSALSVGVGVAETTIARVVRPFLPMFVAMLIALALVTAFPDLSLAPLPPRLLAF